jgi:hypothetical protein
LFDIYEVRCSDAPSVQVRTPKLSALSCKLSALSFLL